VPRGIADSPATGVYEQKKDSGSVADAAALFGDIVGAVAEKAKGEFTKLTKSEEFEKARMSARTIMHRLALHCLLSAATGVESWCEEIKSTSSNYELSTWIHIRTTLRNHNLEYEKLELAYPIASLG